MGTTLKKILNYRGGHIRQVPGGSTFDAYVNSNGKQYRRRFKSVQQAKAWLETFTPGATLTQRQTQDALLAYETLPEGVSLLEAARFYLDTYKPATTDTSAAVLVDIYLGERAHLRARTLEGYRQDLNRVLEWSNDLGEWTRQNITQWLSNLTPSKRNHMVATLRAFLQWCVEHEHLAANPLMGMKAVKVDAPKRQVLSLEDTATLLHTCRKKHPELLHYIALCLFAGLRPDECKRITARNIAHGYIHIDESIAKTHSARTIPMAPNLEAFLRNNPLPTTGTLAGLSPDRFRKHLTALIADSGIAWSNDVMRHSYASYEYERSKDASTTSANLGHTTTTTMFKHYRGLVPPNSGAKYFAINI